MTDSLTAQFSDFDLDPQPAPRHHVFVFKNARNITADCNDCGAGIDSAGHDDSSRHAVAAWVKKHEAGE
jgi:hypothetical protein